MTTELDAFIKQVKASKTGSGSFTLGHKEFEYDVVPKSFEDRVPCFVGYPNNKYLFISDEVPEDFRTAVLAHEVYCADLKRRGHAGHCLMAAYDELAFVSADATVSYLDMRIRTFEALISLYKDSREFVKEANSALEFFRHVKSQVELVSKSTSIGSVEGPKGSYS